VGRRQQDSPVRLPRSLPTNIGCIAIGNDSELRLELITIGKRSSDCFIDRCMCDGESLLVCHLSVRNGPFDESDDTEQQGPNRMATPTESNAVAFVVLAVRLFSNFKNVKHLLSCFYAIGVQTIDA
jgi:hypothetical protein